MNVDNPTVGVVLLRVQHQQLRNFVLLHHPERLDRQLVGRDRPRSGRHDIARTDRRNIAAALQHPPQVAVRDDPHQPPRRRIHHRRRPEPFARDLDDDRIEVRLRSHLRSPLSRHDVTHPRVEFLAQRPPRMEPRKVLCREAPHLEQRHRQRIAHHHLGRGAGGRSQVVRTSLLGHRRIQNMVTVLGQKRLQVAHHPDQPVAHLPDERHQDLDFRRVAALRDAKNNVLRLNDPQVAMNRIGGVHENGRLAGGVERRDDFIGYDGAFSDARDDEPPAAVEDRPGDLHKPPVDIADEPFDGRTLGPDNTPGKFDGLFGIHFLRNF